MCLFFSVFSMCVWAQCVCVLGLLDYGKNRITIILADNEITIIQKIIFELENMMYVFSMSLPKKYFVTLKFRLKRIHKTVK